MMNAYIAILPLAALALSASVGVLAFSKRKESAAYVPLSLGLFTVSAMEAGGALLLSADGPLPAGIGLGLMVAGFSVLPLPWLAFSVSFGKADPVAEVAGRAYPLAAVLFLATLFAVNSGSRWLVRSAFFEGGGLPVALDDGALLISGSGGKYLFLYLAVSLASSLAHIENTLRAASVAERREIKHLAIGAAAAIGFFAYLSARALVLGRIGIQMVPLTSAVVIVSGALISVSLVKRGLKGAKVSVSRPLVFNSITVAVVSAYLAVALAAAYGIKRLSLPSEGFLTAFFLFLSFLGLFLLLYAERLRRRAEIFISRNFFRHKHEFRDRWMESIDLLSPDMDTREITSSIARMLAGSLGASPVRVLVLERAGRVYRDDASGFEIPSAHPVVKHARARLRPFSMKDPSALPGVGELGTSTGAELCAPMAATNEVVGLILLGPDVSGVPYCADDIDLLRALSTHAASQIRNIMLRDRLSSAMEAEVRHRMSTFILHDLKNLANALSLVSHNARTNIARPEFQRDAITAIDASVGRMKKLIERLGDPPRAIELDRRSADISECIRRAIEKLKHELECKRVHLDLSSGALPTVDIDTEAMESVFLNIAKNACEALQSGGRISITCAFDSESLFVTISDNGKGISRAFAETCLWRPFSTTKKTGLGVGLVHSRAILEAHGGSIEVESSEGNGASFTLKLPIKRGRLAC